MTTQGVIARTLVRGNLSHDEVLYNVMLSSAKHLLAGYALSTLSLVGFKEILRYTQNDNVGAHRQPLPRLKTLKATVGSPLVLVPEGS